LSKREIADASTRIQLHYKRVGHVRR